MRLRVCSAAGRPLYLLLVRSVATFSFVTSLALVVILLAWIDARYLTVQASYVVSDLLGARRFSQVPDPSAEERELFERVAAIRRFGIDELGLAETEAFSRYKRINREALVWVVSGVREFSWQRYEWRYPLFGGLPYRGYYRERDAAREAERLRANGYDALYRRVTAFSFLGFLPDPLYSFALERSYPSLANLILHEMTHAALFVPNQGSFNENLATFVGNEGSRLYIEKIYGADSTEYERMTNLRRDHEAFRQEMLLLHEQLVDFYADAVDSDPAAAAGKSAIFDTFQSRLAAAYDQTFRTDAYLWITSAELSNALVDLYISYSAELDRFDELLAHHDGSIPRMLRALQGIRGEIEIRGMQALDLL